MDADTLFNQIREFEPTSGNWRGLESLFEEAFASTDPSRFYPAIFQLFEKYPDDDGAGVFWSALHGMEQFGKYESDLLLYFRRWPTFMTRTMLSRIRNSGQLDVQGIAIDALIGAKGESER